MTDINDVRERLERLADNAEHYGLRVLARPEHIRALLADHARLQVELNQQVGGCKSPSPTLAERRFAGEAPAHADHGRGTLEGGPDDGDCPCRATQDQGACAAAGCGFCMSAQDVPPQGIAALRPSAEEVRAQANMDAGWYARREAHARAMGYTGVAAALGDLESRRNAPAIDLEQLRVLAQGAMDTLTQNKTFPADVAGAVGHMRRLMALIDGQPTNGEGE